MDMDKKKEQIKKDESEDNSKMNINWYPGHMVKTKKDIIEKLKLIDIVIELLDARIPLASKNPDIDGIIGTKNRIIVLNKADLANKHENQRWVEYFDKNNIPCVLMNSLDGDSMKKVVNIAYKLTEEKREKQSKSGIVNSAIKLAVVGIPNVGKSSFINRMVNKNIAKVGNRPGVTRNNAWIRIDKDIILLDTPGVLWPKFNEDIGLKLSYAGCIKDEILDIETTAYKLLTLLSKNKSYLNMLYTRYKIEEDFTFNDIMDLYDIIGKKRGALISGGNMDYLKVGNMILDDFQTGNIGRITLETVDEI